MEGPSAGPEFNMTHARLEAGWIRVLNMPRKATQYTTAQRTRVRHEACAVEAGRVL